MSKELLSDGIKALRQQDTDIDRLFASRHEECVALLTRYISEIELFNPAYGLVGTGDTQELTIKHILDSLAPVGVLSRLLDELCAHNATAPKIADAGSGAGLPGIPLAIALPHVEFTLIERMGRRAGFLLNTKAALNLANVTVEEGELEQTAPGRFNLVTFRAFKPLEPKLLKTLFRACADNGAIAAYKGRREKIEQEMVPLEKYSGEWKAIPCKVPFLNEERHLLVIKSLFREFGNFLVGAFKPAGHMLNHHPVKTGVVFKDFIEHGGRQYQRGHIGFCGRSSGSVFRQQMTHFPKKRTRFKNTGALFAVR
jgi:16S rRNA (guanine527-N7)-methyltransferase